MTVGVTLRERIHGALLGAVVGDAFGSPFEGVGASAAPALVERRLQTPGPWGYSDDALMFIAVAESIRDTGTIVPADLLRAFARHYEPARGFGRGMKLAIRAFESGVRWEDVARTAWPEGSQGNGGAVRVGAVALRRWEITSDLLAAAELATRVTHAHAEAVESALVQVRFVALALHQPELLADPMRAIDCVEADLPGTLFVKQTLEKLRVLVSATPDADVAKACGTSSLARESVPAALTIFLRSRATFSDAITTAARLGGDTDSICALVGCLAGALHGVAGIPSPWIDAIAHETSSPADLHHLADRIGELRAATFPA